MSKRMALMVFVVAGMWSLSLSQAANPPGKTRVTTFETHVVALAETSVGKDGTVMATSAYAEDEGPENLFDNEAETKFCIQCAPKDVGFFVTLEKEAVVTAFQIFTGDDEEDRDPMTITIEGSNAAGDDLMKGASWTKIYFGDSGIKDVTDRNEKGKVVKVENTTSYKSYRVLVASVRGRECKMTQMSEFKLFADKEVNLIQAAIPPGKTQVTTFEAEVVALAETSVGKDGNVMDPCDYAEDEGPENLFDDDPETKFCIQCGFKNVGFYVTLEKEAVVTAFQIFTGNDAEDRDPMTITIEGSNATGDDLMKGASWTKIYSGDSGVENVADRYAEGKVMRVENTTSYKSYRVLVTSVLDSECKMTQMSEFKLFADKK
jgi:hypothetical protein